MMGSEFDVLLLDFGGVEPRFQGKTLDHRGIRIEKHQPTRGVAQAFDLAQERTVRPALFVH